MKQILILSADREFATELSATIRTWGAYEVTVAATVREACLLVTNQPCDLALIPLHELENVVHALHSLQPMLPFVVLRMEAEEIIPEAFQEVIQASVVKTQVQDELPGVLETLFPSKVEMRVQPGANGAERYSGGSDQDFLPILEKVTEEEKVLGAILTHYDALLAFYGSIDDAQMYTIAARVRNTWRETNSALIQFILLPTRSTDLLLFTLPVGSDYLLTLIALPDLNIREVHVQANKVIEQLAPFVEVEPVATSEPAIMTSIQTVKVERAKKPSYALVWQPRKPLPGMLQIALRRALERIAETNDCELKHLLVDAELIHVVVRCPDGRSSAWAAHLFKQKAKEEIQQQFGVPAELWDKGYYATESETPLSQTELNVFLGTRSQA